MFNLLVAIVNLSCVVGMNAPNIKKDKKLLRYLNVGFILFNVVVFLKSITDMTRGAL